MLWGKRAEQEFGVKIAKDRTRENNLYKVCRRIYEGQPDWISDDVKTINLAKTICSELARLTTMNAEVTVTGSARAEWLQDQVKKLYPQLRQWVEYACAMGEAIIKPNGRSVDLLLPDQYIVTEEIGADIVGIIFKDDYYDAQEDKYYTRLEYHRIDDDKYTIINKVYVGESAGGMDHRVSIEDTVWKDLDEETTVENVNKGLFGLLKMPEANNIVIGSNRGISVFSDALEELEDLDVAYSRNSKEVFDSKRTILLDSDRLMASGAKVGSNNKAALVEAAGLPDYVRLVEGEGTGDIYHEINPTLNTAVRLQGIDAYLSQIGYKCGFSNGYFVFNQKTGMVTATQVESDDRRTLQTVRDIRASLEACLTDLIDALNSFADAYYDIPGGEYEVSFDFEDLTLNENEDKMRFLSFVQNGWIPVWYYLMTFEGYTEEEAKEIAMEPTAMAGLFSGLGGTEGA